MPLTKWHSARVKNPNDFLDGKDTWATIEIKPGINLITGKLKKDGPKGPMTGQSYRFDMDKFTVDQAKKWLKRHKVKTILFEPAKPKKEVSEMVKEIFNELCATPGMKIRSKGRGRGLARGKGRGSIGVPFGEEVEETSMIANIAPRMTEKCWGSVMAKKRKKMGLGEQKGEVVAVGGNGLRGIKGSFEDLRDKLYAALKDSQLYGKYPDIVSTFPKKIFVSTDDGRYFEVPYSVVGDDVKLSTGRELEKQVKFLVKEWAEEIKVGMFVA